MDGLHPNEAGREKIAERIMEALEPEDGAWYTDA